ncbi:scavenger receptor cysteine-rich type 1 protein M130-like [Scleropages formosus]|uniref:scavenger receptor cysteine-rich type 1 protein M130-like n=1 Tax=Scleropages formosus TaxID=113540 RepID=UPI0010FA8F6D|nr:scavenger receptor cysteine-rich type 1 protein M130-like [Scleropages formosus]
MVLGDVSCSGTESALREYFVKLEGGVDRCSGRLEVKFIHSWATVCDADFDWQDAQVVCRELDCGGPSALQKGSHFGRGKGSIWSKNFQCEGHESFLHECLTTDRPQKSCTHGVQLTCKGPDDLRLVNGSSPCSGTVEVYRWGQWGTVAQYNWDLNDAAVVCRQLGCGSAVVTPIRAHFGEGSGRVLLRDVSCNGSESALRDCGAVDFRHIDFPHKFDAGVICSDFVQLEGGVDRCSGRVEVKFNQSWATVCDADFDWQDAQVVCRELDCGGPSALHRGSHFGRGEGAIWSQHFQCEGDESFLHQCLTSDRLEQNCTHGSGMGLICTGPEEVRLVNGGSPCAGTLQFYHWGQWWPIHPGIQAFG